MNIAINPYLSFDGNCGQVMEFYKNALNGGLEIMHVKGSPVESEMPPEFQDKVLHARLSIGGKTLLMASDAMPGKSVEKGNNVEISIQLDDEQKGERIFKNLSEGGNITMPWGKTFWGATFGQLTDKYGIHWMVNCETGADQ